MRRKALLLLVALATSILTSGALALSIPPNIWIQQPPPTVSLPPGRAGEYQGRGWNHMRYDSVAGKMILFDGYAELPTYTYENIFANALWMYDPIENRLTLEKLNNWTAITGITEPLPENSWDPTPFDRHFYSCFIYSASKNAAYLWAGANRTIPNADGETWMYDFTARAWRQILTPHPNTVFEQGCSYDPFLEKMILFAGTDHEYGTGDKTYAFDLNTETWEDQAPASSPAPRMGQNLCFDPIRRVSWMFAGAPWGSADSELWSYDAVSNQWTQVAFREPWPSPRRFAHLARDSQHDVILMWGGIDSTDQVLDDTWIFRPATESWERLTPAASPSLAKAIYSTDLDYDPANEFFVLNLGGTFWLFRYSDLTSGVSGGAAPGFSFRIASQNPGHRGEALAFSLPRSSRVRLNIFDASGRMVETVANGTYAAGPHTIQWLGLGRGGPAPSGIYFARLQALGRSLTTRFALVH
jgi:flagellar hook capping protein FlgD/galactose oxidase-like protein